MAEPAAYMMIKTKMLSLSHLHLDSQGAERLLRGRAQIQSVRSKGKNKGQKSTNLSKNEKNHRTPRLQHTPSIVKRSSHIAIATSNMLGI